MKFKVGDKISVTNLYEKTVIEYEYFKKDLSADNICIEKLWSYGLFTIELSENHEVDSLEEIINGSANGHDYELETEDFNFCKVETLNDIQTINIYENDSDKPSTKYLNQKDLFSAGFKSINSKYIIFKGIDGARKDIDLAKITKTFSQSEAKKEFKPASKDAFDRPGYWAIAMTYGEADSEIYLGEKLHLIQPFLLCFGEYGVNFDPFRENPGNKKFDSIQKKDRLILFSHPDEDPQEFCDIFIKIK